jgi:N-acetylglucosaminyl-diphospho-decaprenol L-rhamnosyltransferase
MLPTLDVVIVNWNAGRHLRLCLESLARASRERFSLQRVVTVDNASIDGSCDALDDLPLPLAIVRNAENRGFAAACNQGAAGSTADYLLFLNPDTEVHLDSLDRPIAFLQSPGAHDVGICGVRLENADGGPAIAAARFPSASRCLSSALGLTRLWPSMFPSGLVQLSPSDPDQEVDQVIGAFFLIRGGLFRRLDGFDEQFFLYFEEVDLSRRASRLLCRSMVLTGPSVRHVGGISSSQAKGDRLFFSLRSRLLYGRKHFTTLEQRTLLAASLAELAVRAVHALARGAWGDLRDAWLASGRLARFLLTGDTGAVGRPGGGR